MFPDLLGLALHQCEIMFIKISATFVCAMDVKLKYKIPQCAHGPKGNGSRNLRCVDDWYQV